MSLVLMAPSSVADESTEEARGRVHVT